MRLLLVGEERCLVEVLKAVLVVKAYRVCIVRSDKDPLIGRVDVSPGGNPPYIRIHPELPYL